MPIEAEPHGLASKPIRACIHLLRVVGTGLICRADPATKTELPSGQLQERVSIMTVWFTSDTHFGHANIIGYSQRPFASIEEMDAVLICNWNARVGPQDEVWHLGDFTFRSEKAADLYLKRLNGRKHLVWGNHDSEKLRQLDAWASSQPYAELALDGRKIVLLHYGLRVWNKSHRGALHFYGHSHGSLPGDRQSCDVGVDNPACFYAPWRLEEIERHLAILPERVPVDHHGAP